VVSDAPRVIDVLHLGRPNVIACFQQGGVLVDPGPEVCSPALFEALGDEAPEAVLLTHIHLDHAGAAGAVVRRWPHVKVVVHERGAPHVLDPSKLVASATRLYGDDMARLWGEIVPVPEANIVVVGDDARIDAFGGPWRVAYAPGHASHHVAYLHEPTGNLFAGDVAGVRIGTGPVLPPTPPPDIDVELWHASIARLRAWDAARVAVTHFGVFDDVTAQLDDLEATLDLFAAVARRTDAAGHAEFLRGVVRRAVSDDLAASILQAMPADTHWAGLDRYWSRRETG